MSSKPLPDAEYHAKKLAKIRLRCVIDANGCWLWQGFKTWDGYGGTNYRGREMKAHAAAYRAAGNAVPKGYDVCHKCDVRHCCNPEHLWAGTRKENMQDCSRKGRAGFQSATHCKRGHKFTSENTYIHGTHGRRCCRLCQRRRMRIAAGWPEHLADSLPVTPFGQRPVNAGWRQP